jgi:hypothetical protein
MFSRQETRDVKTADTVMDGDENELDFTKFLFDGDLFSETGGEVLFEIFVY